MKEETLGAKTIADTLIQIPQIPNLIREKSAKYALDPELIAAVVLQESGGNPWAHRYEPGFYRRKLEHLGKSELAGHVPKGTPTLNTEKVDRAISWGVMQIMGDRARLLDFSEDDLTMLIVPEINIELGCRFLRQLLDQDKYKSPQRHAKETTFFSRFLTSDILQLPESEIRYMMALLRYNGGGNLLYPGEVMRRWKKGDAKMLLKLEV